MPVLQIYKMIEKYFNDYENRKIPPPHGPLDYQGIPMFDTDKVGINQGICYHPTVVIQYGLAKFNIWCIHQQDTDYHDFVKCCEWLIDNISELNKNGALGWKIMFPVSRLLIDGAWISGLTQAQGLSLLLRYYQYKNTEEATSNLIKKIAQSFTIPVKQGGVLSDMGDDEFFLQEAKTYRILNGCLSALVGLYEYLSLFDDVKIEAIFNGTIKYLEKHLHHYDLGFWSLYSTGIAFNIADNHYHNTHIVQLKYLGNALNSTSFLKSAEKWEQYQNQKSNQLKCKLYRLIFWNMTRVFSVLKWHRLKFKH